MLHGWLSEGVSWQFLDGLVPMASLHLGKVDFFIQTLLAEGVPVLKQDQVYKLAHNTSSRMQLSTTSTHETGRISRMLHGSSVLAFVPSRTEDGTWGLAHADISTGKINVTEGRGQKSLIEEIAGLHPSQIFYPANSNAELTQLPPLGLLCGFRHFSRPSYQFCPTFLKKKLQDMFEVDSSDHFGLGTLPVAACAVGGLLGYIEDIERSTGAQVPFHSIAPYHPLEFMRLDQSTRNCLEVFQSQGQGQLEGSLLWAMDHTKTAMGKRLLRKWLLRPLLDKELIDARLDAVEVFVNSSILRVQVRQDLSLINDVERLAEEIISNQNSPWDLLAMYQSLNVLCTLRVKLEAGHNPYFAVLENDKTLLDLVQKIQMIFETEASSILQNGLFIKDNVDPTLDALRKEVHLLDLHVEELEKVARECTNISSLEIVRNEKGDHFITVKKNALADMHVPDDFQLYASEASEHVELFITPSLLEHSKRRLEVITKARLREAKILEPLRGEVLYNLKTIQAASQAIAAIDVLASFAEVSASRDYCKPIIVEDSREITITRGRHPVAELLQPERNCFNANSLYMRYQSKGDQNDRHKSTLYHDLDELSGFLPEECWPRPDVLILTGPPASGKSCYLRQAGVIQLLAQVGSYVPAEEAILGIADAIFMKTDGCDEGSMGQSSFERSMKRCADILKNATSQSLILLDGVARGASMTDECAITRAITEFLAQTVKARTILTTQSSSLGSLEDEFPNIAIFQCVNTVDSRFTYCVKPGFSFESPVAALRKIEGFPEWVSRRAGQLICKDDITGEESFQQLLGDDIVGKESLQLKQDDSSYCNTPEEEHDDDDAAPTLLQPGQISAGSVGKVSLQLKRDSSSDFKTSEKEHSDEATAPSLLQPVQISADTTEGEEPLHLEHQQLPEGPSDSTVFPSGSKQESPDISSAEMREVDAINADPLPSLSQGSSDLVLERPENVQKHESVHSELLKRTWEKVLLVLYSYPATHALAKQKGTLVSIQKSSEASHVQMTTSALFLKKFRQHEHATALEKAFSTVLESPIQLRLAVAAERKA